VPGFGAGKLLALTFRGILRGKLQGGETVVRGADLPPV